MNTYVSGTVLREAREMRTQQAERELERSSDQVTLERKRRAWRDRLAATGLFPNLIGFLDARIDPDALETMDQRFEFGLDSLLDGMAARIGQGVAPRRWLDLRLLRLLYCAFIGYTARQSLPFAPADQLSREISTTPQATVRLRKFWLLAGPLERWNACWQRKNARCRAARDRLRIAKSAGP